MQEGSSAFVTFTIRPIWLDLEIHAFRTPLADKEKVSATMQKQVRSTVHFLYRHAFKCKIGDPGQVMRARRPLGVPAGMACDKLKGLQAFYPATRA